MTNKVIPPLTVPIPRGHKSHYRYTEDTWFGLLNRKPNPYISSKIREVLKKEAPEFADLPEPSTFGKIFIRRPKKKKKTFLPVHYVISSASGNILLAYRTKKEALKALNRGFGRWPAFYTGGRFTFSKGKREIIHLPIGSYIWKADPEHNEFDDFSDNNQYPIATRRCPECPNKNSMQGICGCSMLHNIKFQGKAYAWTPPHEAKHKRKRDTKPKLKMSEDALLIYHINLKRKKK